MDEIARKINEEIKSSDVYKKYLSLKQVVETNVELVNLKNELDEIKEKVCEDHSEKNIDIYYKKENEYKSHPIVCEYLRSKEDVNNLLKQIVDILSLK